MAVTCEDVGLWDAEPSSAAPAGSMRLMTPRARGGDTQDFKAMSRPERLDDLLVDLKRRSGRSYEWIGRRANVGRSTVQRYCTGASVPQEFGVIEQIARVCHADSDEIEQLFRLWRQATTGAVETRPHPETPEVVQGRTEVPQSAEGIARFENMEPAESSPPRTPVPPKVRARGFLRLRVTGRSGAGRGLRRSMAVAAIPLLIFVGVGGAMLVSSRGGGESVRPVGLPLAGHTDWALSTVFSQDGKSMASSSKSGEVWLWDVSEPETPRRLRQVLTGPSGGVTSLTFSPDAGILAGSGWDGAIWLWNLAGPSGPERVGRKLTGHTGPVWSAAFSTDGRTLASGSVDGTVRLWDVADWAAPRPLARLLSNTEAVTSVSFSSDDRLLAGAGYSRTVALWDISDRALPQPLTQSVITPDTTFVAAFSPNGRILATGGTDGVTRLWDLAVTAEPRPIGRALTGHTSRIWSLAFSPDGRMLASSGHDKTIRLWNVADPADPTPHGGATTGHTDWVLSVRFSPDGRMLASASADRTVRLWSLPG